jgi:hypothetical protein
MQGTITGDTPRVIGVTCDGTNGASIVLSANVAMTLAAAGVRVLLGSVDPTRQAEVAERCVQPCGVTPLALPSTPVEDVAGRAAILAAVEEAGRAADRIVLDLGPTVSDAATFFGAAVDDLVLLVDADPEAAGRSAGYVAALRRGWAREEVLLVVSGTTDPDNVAAPVREIAKAATMATPRLVPLGVIPATTDLERGRLVVLDDPDGPTAQAIKTIAAQLLVARPFPLRGGIQFFLEDRIGHRRVG